MLTAESFLNIGKVPELFYQKALTPEQQLKKQTEMDNKAYSMLLQGVVKKTICAELDISVKKLNESLERTSNRLGGKECGGKIRTRKSIKDNKKKRAEFIREHVIVKGNVPNIDLVTFLSDKFDVNRATIKVDFKSLGIKFINRKAQPQHLIDAISIYAPKGYPVCEMARYLNIDVKTVHLIIDDNKIDKARTIKGLKIGEEK